MKWITDHIAANKKTYILLSMIYLGGLSIGTVCSAFCPSTQISETMIFMKDFFGKIATGQINSGAVLMSSFMTQLRSLAVLILLGITAIGIPAVLILTGVKGFVTGFSIGLLLRIYGVQGLLISILGIFPAAIFFLPAYGFVAVTVLNLAASKKYGKTLAYSKRLLTVTAAVLPALITFALGILAETYAVPCLMSWISFMFV